MKRNQLLADAILSTAGDAIIAADTQGKITFWNPGAERVFGFSATEAMGKSLDIIIPESLRERHWAGYRQIMAGGESHYGDGDVLAVPAVTKAGKRISVEFTIIRERADGDHLTGLAVIMRDVTSRFDEIRKLKRQLAELGSHSLIPR